MSTPKSRNDSGPRNTARAAGRGLDILDGLFAAEVQSETAKHYEGPQADQKQMQLEETAGIPTGIAPDIHGQVELRKAKRAAAPDNLGTEENNTPA